MENEWWIEEYESLKKTLDEDIPEGYKPKKRPECTKCGKPYICTHKKGCKVCLMCERLLGYNTKM